MPLSSSWLVMNRSKFDDGYLLVSIAFPFYFFIFLFFRCHVFVCTGVLDGFRMMVIAHKKQKRNERIEKKKDQKRRHTTHAVETFETNDEISF